MIEYTDFFSLINAENSQPVAGVFMTYGFDAELFEKHVLPDFLGVMGSASENELYFRYQIASGLRQIPITVLSDGHQYLGGQTFLYKHIAVHDVTFHPKCYLLLYSDHLRVIIGSCNLTKAGLCYNAETVWAMDLQPSCQAAIVNDLLKLLEWIKDTYVLDEADAVCEIIRYLQTCQGGSAFPCLLGTVSQKDIFTQYFERLKGYSCKRLSIVSPFFESDRQSAMEESLLLSFAEKFLGCYPQAKLRLYFPADQDLIDHRYHVLAPAHLLNALCERYKKAVELFAVGSQWEREEEQPTYRMLHGKLLIAELADGNKLTLSGSVNFTKHAMYSSIKKLSNIEIGVMNEGRSTIALPAARKVTLKELTFKEVKPSPAPLNIFVTKVQYEKEALTITFDLAHVTCPFKMVYQDVTLGEWTSSPEETVKIDPFKIKRAMYLTFMSEKGTFYYPIDVVNSAEVITEDLKLTDHLSMNDVIDYLAGQYKSLMALTVQRSKKEEGATPAMGAYFKHNLQRYYKALDTLKRQLEEPFYTQAAFRAQLTEPAGLKVLVDFIETEYEANRLEPGEAFIFAVEIENMVKQLHFKEDSLKASYKNEALQPYIQPAVNVRKTVYQKAAQKVKKQYQLLLSAYELEVLK